MLEVCVRCDEFALSETLKQEAPIIVITLNKAYYCYYIEQGLLLLLHWTRPIIVITLNKAYYCYYIEQGLLLLLHLTRPIIVITFNKAVAYHGLLFKHLINFQP